MRRLVLTITLMLVMVGCAEPTPVAPSNQPTCTLAGCYHNVSVHLTNAPSEYAVLVEGGSQSLFVACGYVPEGRDEESPYPSDCIDGGVQVRVDGFQTKWSPSKITITTFTEDGTFITQAEPAWEPF